MTNTEKRLMRWIAFGWILVLVSYATVNVVDAAWTTPITWTTSQLVDAATMNAQIRDNLNILKTSINDDGTLKYSGFNTSEFAAGNSGSAITLDFNTNGPAQTVTRNANCTFTLTAPSKVATVIVRFHHDATANAYTVTFSPAVKWAGGSAPTFTNTSGADDLVSIYWNGSIWIGSQLPNVS